LIFNKDKAEINLVRNYSRFSQFGQLNDENRICRWMASSRSGVSLWNHLNMGGIDGYGVKLPNEKRGIVISLTKSELKLLPPTIMQPFICREYRSGVYINGSPRGTKNSKSNYFSRASSFFESEGKHHGYGQILKLLTIHQQAVTLAFALVTIFRHPGFTECSKLPIVHTEDYQTLMIPLNAIGRKIILADPLTIASVPSGAKYVLGASVN